MKTGRVITSVLSALILGSVVFAGTVMAEFPTKPIKIIVPYKPGGGSDRIARTLDKFTKEEFGNSLIFEYKTGAGGHVGTSFLAKARPDGYTIGTYNTPDVAIGPITGAARYTLDDMIFLGRVSLDPVVFTTRSESAYKNINEFLKDAKARPGKVRVGIAGPKGGTHLAALDLFEKQNVKVSIVLFGGGSELAAAVLGNQVDVGSSGLAPFLGSMEKTRILGTAGDKRHVKAPDVPTLREQGIDLIAGTGRIFLAPKGIEASVVERLRTGIKRIFDLPEYKEEMRKIGQQPNWLGGEELGKSLKEFNSTAEEVIEKHNLK